MEITEKNFNDDKTLRIVKKSIESADFIAIDTEFSGKFHLIATYIYSLGYSASIEDKQHEYEDVEERY